MIGVAEASKLVAANSRTLESTSTPLNQLAGRVLRQSVFAERDQPPFDRVTMDGIAVRFHDGQRQFRIAARALAGEPQKTLDQASDCIEVMTGCPLPRGCDTVIPVENYHITAGDVTLNTDTHAAVGQCIHKQGSDHPIGVELLKPGQFLSGPEIALVASAGLREVKATRPPRTAIIATGNELVAAGEPIEPHQIRLSNGPAISAALELHGFSDYNDHHLPDSRDILGTKIEALLNDNDVLVLSGGVSMGKADFVPGVLSSLGVIPIFHKIAQRPGKPLWFGVSPTGGLVFGLPGNPVSTLVCLHRYVLPALARISGRQATTAPTVALGNDYEFKPAMTAFVPVTISRDGNDPSAVTVTTNTSGDFAALAGTSGFVELDAERTVFRAGEKVPLYRWC